MRLWQKLQTKNDKDGAPKRIWILYETGRIGRCDEIISIFDEQYGGRPLGADYEHTLPLVEVDLEEYDWWLHFGETHSILTVG